MKVQYLKSASVLVEHDGVRVLCDPWLTDGIYYGSWYHYPPLEITPEDFSDVDYIYISHVHPDHLDPETLRRLPDHIPVLIANYKDRFVHRILKQCGFEQIIELQGHRPYRLADDFFIEVLGADFCDPALCGHSFACQPEPDRSTYALDTLAIFHGGGKVVVNTNDCPYGLTASACKYIVDHYGKVDFLLVGYAGAGPYPQCFEHQDEEALMQKGEQKKRQFIRQCSDYLEALRPAYFLPFAGQYTLGGKLWHLNRYRGVPELEDLESLFASERSARGIASEMVLLNSGEWFDLVEGAASSPYRPISMTDKLAYIERELSGKSYVYESDAPCSSDELLLNLQEAQRHMIGQMATRGIRPRLHDWNVYMDVGDEEGVYHVPLTEGEVARIPIRDIVEPCLAVQLDAKLLKRMLERKAHWNNAEIGSHLRFKRAPDVFDRPLFTALCYLHLPSSVKG